MKYVAFVCSLILLTFITYKYDVDVIGKILIWLFTISAWESGLREPLLNLVKTISSKLKTTRD